MSTISPFLLIFHIVLKTFPRIKQVQATISTALISTTAILKNTAQKGAIKGNCQKWFKCGNLAFRLCPDC